MIDIIYILLIFVVPYLIIRFKNNKLTKLFGTIGMAYFLGLVIALIIFLLNNNGVTLSLDSDIGETASFAAIAIGIPLLLFGANLQEAKKLSKTVLKSFLALIISVVLVSTIVFFVYGKSLLHGDALSAAAVGLYTGGTPNLNSITNILIENFAGKAELITLANLSDIIIGALFYIFLLFLAKPLLDKILPYHKENTYLKEASKMKNTEDFKIKEFKTSYKLFKAFIVALIMTIISAGFGVLVWVILGSEDGRMLDFLVPVMLIGVTIFGVIGSFNKKIRETEGTNILGHYLILVFSFALSSSVDFSRLVSGDFTDMLILYGSITIGAFIVHMIFARFLKIDSDCMIVTLTAGLYGPAFVPAITSQIKNDSLTVPGLICGSIGYALGTFLGLALGMLFAIGM